MFTILSSRFRKSRIHLLSNTNTTLGNTPLSQVEKEDVAGEKDICVADSVAMATGTVSGKKKDGWTMVLS